ncbi:hypothetical protein NDU88_007344 [Pleurodeles waltl]|uniref:Uncharacterized protein n=1 Tax=Pleurodeles waltl TaxID=8319 RepID=A0AAV7MFS6_PLEWA|nr:hypothetical protein NDU88_007344 [Pleurodeles waltl]
MPPFFFPPSKESFACLCSTLPILHNWQSATKRTSLLTDQKDNWHSGCQGEPRSTAPPEKNGHPGYRRSHPARSSLADPSPSLQAAARNRHHNRGTLLPSPVKPGSKTAPAKPAMVTADSTLIPEEPHNEE